MARSPLNASEKDRESLCYAEVPRGGEPLAIRELEEWGARAKVHAPGWCRFHATAKTVAALLRSARTLLSLAVRLHATAPGKGASAPITIAWDEWLAPGDGVDASTCRSDLDAPHLDESDPHCRGTLRWREEKKGRRSLLLDLELDRGEFGDPAIAVALRQLPANAELTVFSEEDRRLVRELLARFAGSERRGRELAPGAHLLPWAGVTPVARESSPGGTVRIVDRDANEWRASAAAESTAVSFVDPQLYFAGQRGTHVIQFWPTEADSSAIEPKLADRLRTLRGVSFAVLGRGELPTVDRFPLARRVTFGEDAAAVEWGELAPPTDEGSSPRRREAPATTETFETPERAFETMLAENARLRRRWPEKRGTDAYRLYDRQIPEIPIVVDRYGDAVHITVMPPQRGSVDRTRELSWIDRASAILGVDPRLVFVKRKERRAAGEQHRRVEEIGERRIVREAGLRYFVNLTDYVDTGLFLDHRETRRIVRHECAGKNILNLFCYTGSFTVAAAAGGAGETYSVDTSATYLAWARENLKLNDLDGPQHHLIRDDVFAALEQIPPTTKFGWVIFDPPTRSNRHGSELTWDVQRDYVPLLERLAPMLSPDGIVLFSTNFRRFKLDRDALRDWSVEELTPGSIPPDIGDRRIHRLWSLSLPAKGTAR